MNRGLLGLVAVAALTASCSSPRPVIEDFGPIAAWELTDQRGQPFGTAQVAGRPYVVSFFFTSCQTICPKIMDAMGDLQARLAAAADRVQYISITVDPDNDTPSALKAWGDKRGVAWDRWAFLTGDHSGVLEVVSGAFMTHMGRPFTTSTGLIEIGHGARLMLIDARGHFRGNFETSPEGIAGLAKALEALLTTAP